MAESEGIYAVIESEDFKNPNKAYAVAVNENQKALYRNELLKKQLELKKQNLELRIRQMAVITKDDMEAINAEYEEPIQEQIKANLELEKKVYDSEAPMREQTQKRELYESLKKEYEVLSAKQKQLEIQDNVFKERLSQNQKQKGQNLPEIDLSISAITDEIGQAKAGILKSQQIIDKRESLLKYHADNEELITENEELAKGVDQSMLKISKEIGEKVAELQQNKELNAAQNAQRASEKRLQEADAITDYRSSQKYKANDETIAQLNVQTRLNEQMKEQQDIINKSEAIASRTEAEMNALHENYGDQVDGNYVPQIQALTNVVQSASSKLKSTVDKANEAYLENNENGSNTWNVKDNSNTSSGGWNATAGDRWHTEEVEVDWEGQIIRNQQQIVEEEEDES